MRLPHFIVSWFRFLLRHPPIGKVVSSVLGLLEVPILDTILFLDRHTRLDYFDASLMGRFTRVYGSRVIPLNISLTAVPTVSPTEEILNIIRRLPVLGIGYCYCRSAHRNCNNELWTCIHVGTGQSLKELSTRMPIESASLEEVEQLLYRSDKAGLVHQLITAPTRDYFYVICNCCPCCCVMLRSAIQHGFSGAVLASNFIAEIDPEKCANCGSCVERCHFKARSISNKRLEYAPEKCAGCGLCVTVCGTGATRMVRRSPSSQSIPSHFDGVVN